MKIVLLIAALIGLTSAGCATDKTKSSTSNGTNSASFYHRSSQDALAGKIVLHKTFGRGVDFHLFGGTGGYSPLEVRAGEFSDYWLTIPTSTNAVNAAPWADANGSNLGWFNDAFGENHSTAPNLIPPVGYAEPQISSTFPLAQGVSGVNFSTNTPAVIMPAK